ncbi:class I adenylate-forming enzyme family protein [Methylopila sp. Yamaguchi]|uniref:class I adenylate-forming enzyme family protein n=1 Tax=Methylopila sp. Yamaguchi TaxID=1437817 RepID=UPI000CC6275B|nr:class I adenylate-forming enzyme family protein [Methylopila sp. Yamaguchi]GBD50129.1 acyl-CoA synthetases (AMP-forming)/AMP-acid ligases II [Methylopila sp. Yamaguchi]
MARALLRLLETRLASGAGVVEDGNAAPLRATELLEAGSEIAAALRRGGLGENEPVFVVVGNRSLDLAAFLGVWMAGGVVAPVHVSASETTWAAVRASLGARVVVESGEALFARDAPAPSARRELDDAAVVVFTSGTTGAPKGVVIRHRGFAGKLAALEPIIPFGSGDVVAIPLQLTFIFGQWTAFLALCAGASVSLVRKFSPQVFDALYLRNATALCVVPSMLRALERRPRPLDRLRTIVSGGEPLGAVLAETTVARWPGAAIFDCYGLTETGAADFCAISTESEPRGAWIGRPTGGVLYRIRAEDGGSLPAGRSGELQIRTEHIMAAYLGEPELTAAAFADGWFRTGDLAVEDPDGEVRLVGRIKEVISRAGNKIYPAEIEATLLRHPDVAAALCTGVPDERIGERIHAAVVLRDGAAATPSGLCDWLGGCLERYKVPDVLVIRDAVPLGATGKASRAALRELAIRESLATMTMGSSQRR